MIQHIVLALLIQLSLATTLRSWPAGTAAACAWAISREVTQAEYAGSSIMARAFAANMPWWGGLDLRVWQYPDPWLDWIVPCAVVLIIALAAHRRGRKRNSAA